MSDDEKCQRCGEGPDPDLRTLWHYCFYDMSELGLPFEKVKMFSGNDGNTGRDFYTLRVCKSCRADWMSYIKSWFSDRPRNPVGSGIFVRRNGATVEITEEEWYAENPGREPVRVRG